MKQHGRKSRAQLAVVAPIGPSRAAPPADLTKEQADVWRSVVGALPADWFKPEQYDILAEYCRHVIRARQLDRRIEALFAEDWSDDIKPVERVMKMAATETTAINNLARAMRLTQQSRLKAETAHTRSTADAAGKRPWEE